MICAAFTADEARGMAMAIPDSIFHTYDEEGERAQYEAALRCAEESYTQEEMNARWERGKVRFMSMLRPVEWGIANPSIVRGEIIRLSGLESC